MQIFIYQSGNVYNVMLYHKINITKYYEMWYQNLNTADIVNPTWYVDIMKSAILDP